MIFSVREQPTSVAFLTEAHVPPRRSPHAICFNLTSPGPLSFVFLLSLPPRLDGPSTTFSTTPSTTTLIHQTDDRCAIQHASQSPLLDRHHLKPAKPPLPYRAHNTATVCSTVAPLASVQLPLITLLDLNQSTRRSSIDRQFTVEHLRPLKEFHVHPAFGWITKTKDGT